MPFKKILWATDFGRCSDHALQRARQLGETLGAQLRGVFVAPVAAVPPMGMPGDLSTPIQSWLISIEGDARERFQKMAPELAGGGLDFSWEVRPDVSPAEGVIQAANEWGADLIIIGRQGHGALENLLLGSTAVKVVNSTHVPVLVIPEGTGDDARLFKRFLVPVDCRDVLEGEISLASDLADSHQGSLMLLYVLEHPYGRPPDDVVTLLTEQVERVMARELDKITSDERIPEVIKRMTTAPSAWQGIVENARTWDADLVVMATHGRGLLGRLLMGSVTNKVLQLCPGPVLVVPPKK